MEESGPAKQKDGKPDGPGGDAVALTETDQAKQSTDTAVVGVDRVLAEEGSSSDCARPGDAREDGVVGTLMLRWNG